MEVVEGMEREEEDGKATAMVVVEAVVAFSFSSIRSGWSFSEGGAECSVIYLCEPWVNGRPHNSGPITLKPPPEPNLDQSRLIFPTPALEKRSQVLVRGF